MVLSRSRNIKPGFYKNEYLAELPPLTRILFSGLWGQADREGRLEDRPKRIKAEVLPYDECDVDRALQDLHGAGFIQRYEINNRTYIQIVMFSKHQNPHKNERESTIPPPAIPEQNCARGDTSTVQAPEQHSSNRADSFNLIPDSLSSDSIVSEPTVPLVGKPDAAKPKRNPIPVQGPWPSVQALADLYNDKTPDECPAVREISDARTKKARKYLNQFPEQEFWEKAFDQIHRSPFLRGHRNSNGHGSFVAGFDWLLTVGKDGTENVVKVTEGNYLDGQR
jgi:hypothetical protein